MFAKQQIVQAIVAVGLFGIVSSCARAPNCPATVDQASSGDYEVIGDNAFVGTGFAIRFVAAEEADARGYDLNVTRWIHGRPGDAGIFLLSERSRASVPGSQF